jgi:hypothetical protein
MIRRRYVSVQIDMSDIDTDDLMEELRDRQKSTLSHDAAIILAPPLKDGGGHALHENYYAIKFGMDARAVDLMRVYLNDQLGTAL